MKTLLMSFVLALSVTTQAQDFHFVPPGAKDDKVAFDVSSTDALKAAQVAAEKCFDHFTQGQGVNDDYGIDVINLCANLRLK